MKETELAAKFIEYLSDFDLYFEVQSGNIVDIVAVKGKYTSAFEVKTSFGLAVLEQAFNNLRSFNYSYCAVPKTRYGISRFAEKICLNEGIGVLTYDPVFRIFKEVIKPRLNRKPKYVPILQDYQKLSQAGSQSNRITAFKNTVYEICRFVKMNGDGYPLKQVLSKVNFHYETLTSARNNMYQWINNGVVTELRLEKGKLFLTDTGQELINTFDKYGYKR